MTYPCSICGQYHGDTACPVNLYEPEPSTAGPGRESTINGLTFGEQQIIERLDKLIALVQTRPAPDLREHK